MMSRAISWHNFLDYAALSDIGLRRSNNQDALSAVPAGDEANWRQRGHLFMVADGMGAHAAGELASKLACDGVPHAYHKLVELPPPEAIRQALLEANAQIHDRGRANVEFHGMGTTCSVLVVLPQGALVAHVGDSRVYRLRGTELQQLTFDHSLQWEVMAAGKMSEKNVPQFVPKNIITRSLGPHAEVQVDLEGFFPLAEGDVFLLCSDGLSGQVTDEEIGMLLGSLPPEAAARILVDLANLRGGPDNISVIVARVKGLPPGAVADVIQPPTAAPNRSGARLAALLVAGTALVAAILAAVTGHFVAAAGAGILTVATAAWRFLSGRQPPKTRKPDDGRLGNAPHRVHACAASRNSVEGLAQLSRKLREAAVEEKWTLDWEKFDAFDQDAYRAAAEEDHSRAVAQYGRAISFLMRELRTQREREELSGGSSPPG